MGCGLWWLFLHLCSLLSTDPTPSLLSLLSLVVVFGCDGCGFWLCPELKRGCGSWLGPLWVVGRRGCGSVEVVDRRGCGLWIGVVVGCGLWVVDRRGWVVVVDRRAGMKRVVGRGSAAEVGRGCGWVVAEVAPVMTFFEWVCSSGFQIVVGL